MLEHSWGCIHPASRPHLTFTGDSPMRWVLSAFFALGVLGNFAFAAEPSKPVTAIAAYPAALKLKGMDDAPQLLITGKCADGREIDLTHNSTYSVSDPKVIRIETNGRVFPVTNGTAEITASVNGMSVKVSDRKS